MNIRKSLQEIKKESTPVFEHVRKAVENASLTDYALIIREAGSGKTRIGAEIMRDNLSPSSYALWLCPAALVEQASSDLTEVDIPNETYPVKEFPRGKVLIASYDMVKNKIKQFTSVRWSVVISDEFHRTRNKGTIINEATWHIRKKSNKFYALTATPFNNTEQEFFELISLVLGKNVVNKYEQSITIGKKKGILFSLFSLFKKVIFGINADNPVKARIVLNKRTVEKTIKQYIDYMEPEEYMGFINRPTPVSSVENIELKDEEVKQYIRIMKSKALSNKEMPLRILLLKEGSSKIQKAVEEVTSLSKNKDNRILVFSNFVSSGLGALSKQLSIPHAVYKGGIGNKEREEIVQKFKEGTTQILLISPSGFEGLNLKGTTHVIVLDPHYNPSKTSQLIARGLRAGSKTEKVIIKHYCSVSSKLRYPTIDEKIIRSSVYKKEKNEALEKLLKDVKREE